MRCAISRRGSMDDHDAARGRGGSKRQSASIVAKDVLCDGRDPLSRPTSERTVTGASHQRDLRQNIQRR